MKSKRQKQFAVVFLTLTLFVVPEKVDGLSRTSGSSKSISLMWKKVSGTADVNYTVTWASSHTNGLKLVTNNNNTTTIDNLNSSFRYGFQVQASNLGGRGVTSDTNYFLTGKREIYL